MLKTKVKKDFPLLVAQPKLTYLDNAATSQTPLSVLNAMQGYYTSYNANVHRGVYYASMRATKEYEAARGQVASCINAQPCEIVFTGGATMALNLLAYSLCSTLSAGDEVVTTTMEHHSNFVPWQQLSKRFGFRLKLINVTQNGELDMAQARELIGSRTKVVTFVHMSNVLGTVNPARELIDLAHSVGALAVVDGAQSIAHMPLDMHELDCDFFVFSGHKMYGPKGIGVLYGKKKCLETLPPFLYGGDMISAVSEHESQWNEVPYKFEAGTPNIPGAIGLGAACAYLSEIGMDNIAAHEKELTAYALKRLCAMPGTTVYGQQNEHHCSVISFTVHGMHPHDVATLLDREGVAVRAGNHCAMPLMQTLGINGGTVRVSLALYNTKDDVDKLTTALRAAQKKFGT